MKENGIYDNKFYGIIEMIGDLFLLNVIFIIFCLPVFTIGASLSALINVTRQMEKKDSPAVIRCFYRHFREHFITNTKLWAILFLAGAIWGFDIWFGMHISSAIRVILLLFCGVFGVVYIWVLIYCFPAKMTFHTSVRETIRKAILIAVSNLPTTLLLCVLYFAPTAFILLRPVLLIYILPIIIAFGFSGIHLISAHFINNVMARYETKTPGNPSLSR